MRRAGLLKGANRILEAATESATAEELGAVCLEVAMAATESEFGFIGEVHGELLRELAVTLPDWDLCAMDDAEGHHLPAVRLPVAGLYGTVVRTGATLCTNAPGSHPSAVGLPEGHPPITSFLGVPIRVGEQTTGLVGVANRAGGYGPEQASLLEDLTFAIASAMRVFRYTQQLQQSTELIDAHMTNSPLAVIEFDTSFTVSRWSHEAERIFGYSADEVLGNRIVDLRWVYEEDVPLVEAESERLFSGSVSRSKNTNRNYRKDGSVIWCEWYSSAIHDENGALVSVLSLVLDVTARRESEAYAEALGRINKAVHSTLDFDEIMRRVVIETTEVAGLEGGGVYVRDGETWRFAYGHNMPEGLADPELRGPDALLLMNVAAQSDAIVMTDAASDEALAKGLLEDSNVSSLLALPLHIKGKPFGVLMMGTPREGFVLDDRLAHFMRQVGSTVSLALENARLYNAERSIADRLQSALLTIPEEIEGINFAHAYRSATDAARVGGDFYDLFELGGSRVGIVIGDVAGKGISAAVLTSLVKNTVQAHASEPGKTPAQVLELTNDIIFKSTSMEAFVTVFFGVLDCRDGTMVYANGGHTSGMLLRPGGPVALQVTGPLLGALASARFRDTWARLDPGNVLFLYTDGLTEARRDGELYGEARLFEALTRSTGTAPLDVLSDVIGEVVAFARGLLNDDLALLAVQLTGCEAQLPEQQRLDV
ncbi:PAS domain S-box protein [bacterium]|nr:PAS domain S-box protein [bacterium]